MNTNINFNKPLQNDNVFVSNSVTTLAEITGRPCRKGLKNVILSEGQIVNVVSNSYGHLPNERIFYEVENQLINTGINYLTRSINRENRSFAVDYILNDESYHINVKNGMDKVKPMLRFVNSYDGSCQASGHFGFFREVCSNGLHVSQANIGFSIKHRGNVCEIVLPRIADLVKRFLDNEFYSLHKKFEVLAETPLTNVNDFVKLTAEKLKLFVYESSEQNPEPSKNARIVLDTIYRESDLLHTRPNLWIGYNAFNDLLHSKLKKTFDKQRTVDALLFETIDLQTADYEMVW